MNRTRSWTAVVALIALTACRSAGGRVVQSASAAPPASLESRVPSALGAFTRVEREVLPSSAGTRFRFRDTSSVLFSLFLYAPEVADWTRYPEPTELLEHEAEKLFQIQEIEARRGAITNLRRLATRRDSVDVFSRQVLGHVVATSNARRGQAQVDLQYLYLIDSMFVKVRATVPAPSWPRSDIEPAVKALVTALAK
jgi:hypothetical protein